MTAAANEKKLRKRTRGRMWPFSEMSLSTATLWSDIANAVLIVSLFFGVIATIFVFNLSNVKERHWDAARDKSQERIVGLEAETAKANAELGRAQADIAKANAEIAEARQQTATLEKDAAAANERTAEIMKASAWRMFTQEQIDKITLALSNKTGKYLLSWVANDAESFALARTLRIPTKSLGHSEIMSLAVPT